MATDPSDDLFPQVRNPPNTRVINDRCLIRTQDEHRLVIVSGIVLAPYALTDDRAPAYAMVSLVEQGWANQREVARAWDCSARTVRRHQRRFEAGGLAAWGRGRGYPQGRRRLQRARIQLIQRLKAEGCANREIARQLGVSEVAIRKLLRRLGWQEPTAEPMALALDLNPSAPSNLSAPSKPARVQPSPEPAPTAPLPSSAIGSTAAAATTLDTDPSDRWGDRLMAYLGLLDDAAPLLGSRTGVARAGVLWALPPLVQSGVFACAHTIYGSLGPAFYGLRTSLLTLLLMALLRIKRPEGLKEHSPQELGRVLGWDRAPEVKTLRRKLARLAAAGKAAQLGEALARPRVARRGRIFAEFSG